MSAINQNIQLKFADFVRRNSPLTETVDKLAKFFMGGETKQPDYDALWQRADERGDYGAKANISLARADIALKKGEPLEWASYMTGAFQSSLAGIGTLVAKPFGYQAGTGEKSANRDAAGSLPTFHPETHTWRKDSAGVEVTSVLKTYIPNGAASAITNIGQGKR